MLVLLLALLLFELPLLGLHDLEVGLPPLLAMQNHLACRIDAVGYFGEGVIAAAATYPHLLVAYSVLLPAEVAFVDEPADAADLPAVEGE